MKKIISILSLLLILTSTSNLHVSYAVTTNEESTPWTMEKAEHLAKKALYGVSQEKVLELFNAGSAVGAVNILFPSINGPDRTNYDLKMASLLNTGALIKTDDSDMREYYADKKFNDPYEAKSKLAGIFEDTFSVNTIYNRINYQDIEATYDLIYENTLGSYKRMVQQILYTNGTRGDYSLGEYLDLFNQTNPDRPNENYSREMLQLFLMLEYKPTESEDLGSTRNYTEKDVAALAKILYGLEADENTHLVTYNGSSNTNTDVIFLDGELKTGDNFPFYNHGSGSLNIQTLQIPIAGNNGLQDNIVDYIFSKRENEIALFLADKMYRYYIGFNPLRSDLELIKDEIITNNFEIYPTVKWLLSQNMMYSDKSMNSTIFKNPLELIIGTAKLFGLSSENINMKYGLTVLNWRPYGVGKIFGRDGFDNNAVFFTPYVSVKWTKESSLLVSSLIDNNIGFINTGSTTATGIIEDLENKLYLGKRLDNNTKDKLITYLTHDLDGNQISIDLSDPQYIARNIHGLIYMMLNQPEYVLQSGYDITSNENSGIVPFYENNNKLVLIKAHGGMDWLHVLINKEEYPIYLDLRLTGSLTGTGVMSLNDKYYINSNLSPYKGLYDSNNLRIINRIGTPNHSRGHDSASRKVTSLNNKYGDDVGIVGNFITNEDPGKTVVLHGGSKPPILRNGSYMGIGGSAIYGINRSSVWLSTSEQNYKISTLKDILINRNFNGAFGDIFRNSAIIDTVSRESKANGGREGSGYNMDQRLTFLESLYDAGLGNTAWLRTDGHYDTHRNQKDYMNFNLDRLSRDTSNFFNRVKDRYNVTIVIYSEFGRTNRINSSNGVDHGTGGGMFIISNNNKLLNDELPKKIYGNASFKNSDNNWLGVGIDYRSVYTALFKSLYNKDISVDLKGIFNINSYIDNEAPDIELSNIKYTRGSNSTSNRAFLSFQLNDTNFKPREGSYIKFEYGKDIDNMYEYSKYYINRTMTVREDFIELKTPNIIPGDKYYYKITLYDNQYNEKIIEGSFISPTISLSDEINASKPTRLNKYQNLTVSGSVNLVTQTSSGIVLSNSGTISYGSDENIKVLAHSGTYINELTSSGTSIWDGTFLTPTLLNKSDIVPTQVTFNGKSILDSKIAKLFKVGSDNLGVSMKMNKYVDIEVNNIDNTKNYVILSSDDGINWIKNDQTYSKNGNKLTFSTNHFTLFAVVELNSQGDLASENGDDIVIPSSVSRGGGGGSRGSRLIKDVCEYGDYSLSYYDRTCGIDIRSLDMDHTLLGNNNFDGTKQDQDPLNNIDKNLSPKMREALRELQIMESEKAEVFEELFMQELIDKNTIEDKLVQKELMAALDALNKSKKSILILLREQLSSITIGEHKLIYIKNSKLNDIFKRIGLLIISKDFSEEKNLELFKMLNKVIIHSSINELQIINKDVIVENNKLLKKSIQFLVKRYKNGNVVIKKPTVESNKKITESKKEIKKETVQEKIRRINEKNKTTTEK